MEICVNVSYSTARSPDRSSGQRGRIVFAVFLTGVSAYLTGLWFIWGVTASKWIGLDSMASQMQTLNGRSRLAGYVALLLQFVAFWVFPPKRAQQALLGSGYRGFLSYPEEARTDIVWRAAWERYGRRLAFLVLGTGSFLLLYVAIGWLSFVLNRSR